MEEKKTFDKVSIHIPDNKKDLRPLERLRDLGSKRDRSVSYLGVEAILQYLSKEERTAG
jgi:ribosomal protein S15P/S13E